MQDIYLNSNLLKLFYFFSWICLILAGFIAWVIVIFLYNYGKDTVDNKPKEKNLLNKTYQKFTMYFAPILFILELISIFLVVNYL